MDNIPAEYVQVVPLSHLMMRRRSEPHDVMAATQQHSHQLGTDCPDLGEW